MLAQERKVRKPVESVRPNSDEQNLDEDEPMRTDETLAEIAGVGLHRNHYSESQRAMVAAKLANMQQGARTDIASIEAMSQPQAAEMLNVSRSNVQRAAKVIAEAEPEIVQAVEQGNVSSCV